MSESSPARGAYADYPGNTAADAYDSFDEVVKQRAEEVLRNGEQTETTPWFDRKKQERTIATIKTGQWLTAMAWLKNMEIYNPKLSLDTKRKALIDLETSNSADSEIRISEEMRYYLIGSIAFQLANDFWAEDKDKTFSINDFKRFFTNEFSFETRRDVGKILAQNNAIDEELADFINKNFGGNIIRNFDLIDYEAILPELEDNFGGDNPVKTNKNTKDKPGPFTKSDLIANDGAAKSWSEGLENTKPCHKCLGAGKILEPVDGTKQLLPVICEGCGGKGRLPIKE